MNFTAKNFKLQKSGSTFTSTCLLSKRLDCYSNSALTEQRAMRWQRGRFAGTRAHCSKLEKVLNENDTPLNQQFLLVYTLILSK